MYKTQYIATDCLMSSSYADKNDHGGINKYF